MKKLMLILLAAGVFSGAEAQDQFDRYLSFSWDGNIPLSNTSFVKSPSFKGFQIGYHERINEHFYMCVDFNNATYYDYSPRQTYDLGTGALTTDFYKYVVSYGVAVGGEYYFNPGKRIMPFAGLGAGINYNSYGLYYNIYDQHDSKFGLLIRPQAGAIVKIGKQMNWGVIGAVHYDYSTAKSDDFSYTNFTSIGVRVGLVLWIGRGSIW